MISLPWPPKELNPNARAHFRTKAAAVKAYREQAHWLTIAAPVPLIRETDELLLSIVFYPPDKRRRDLDNMLSSIKAGLDGIADALLVNDQRFALNLRRAETVKHGRVVIVLGEV